jgi:hypothetical protein
MDDANAVAALNRSFIGELGRGTLAALGGYHEDPSHHTKFQGDTSYLATLQGGRRRLSVHDWAREAGKTLPRHDGLVAWAPGATPRPAPEVIPKSSPRVRARASNAPQYSLMTEDIDGAAPASKTFSSSRVVDTFNPVYKLPTAPVRPVTPPRFVRDPMEIVGERRDRAFKRAKPRVEEQVSYTKRTIRPELLRPTMADDSHLGRETTGRSLFRSARETNPVSPRYNLPYMEDEFAGSHPPGPRHPLPDLRYTTADVNSDDSLLRNSLLTGRAGTRREHRKLVFAGDVVGAQPGSTHFAALAKKEKEEAQRKDRPKTPEIFRRLLAKANQGSQQQQQQRLHSQRPEELQPVSGVNPKWWPNDQVQKPYPFMTPSSGKIPKLLVQSTAKLVKDLPPLPHE